MVLIPALRGMRDILPAETGKWRVVEAVAAACFSRYGYGELRTPVLERAELFQRQLGEHTEVVQKEMYTFTERLGGGEICLRPEATVSAVRALVAGGLHRRGVARVWYGGPMFRRERPQKGRYRQFWQLGAEAVGSAAPAIDAEQILLLARLWDELGIAHKLELRINNLGAAQERAAYCQTLAAYFRRHAAKLDKTARARIDDNPLRILDSKDDDTAAIAAAAPQMAEHLGKESRQHCATVKEIIAATGVKFVEDAALVRGLDYYNLTVFEWVLAGDKRRQNALCGGGRYDGLSEQIGGPPLPGCGFALGLDRLIDLADETPSPPPDCCLIAAGGSAVYCARIAEILRDAGLSVWPPNSGNLSKQLKKAAAARASLAVIVGEAEETAEEITIKRLRDGAQQRVLLTAAGTVAAAMHSEDKQ